MEWFSNVLIVLFSSAGTAALYWLGNHENSILQGKVPWVFLLSVGIMVLVNIMMFMATFIPNGGQVLIAASIGSLITYLLCKVLTRRSIA